VNTSFIIQELKLIRTGLIKFIIDQLTQFQTRNDYKELLQLSLFYLGEEFPENNNFRKPGASSKMDS